MAELGVMKPLISAVAFTNALGWLMGIAGYAEFSILGTVLFLIIQGSLLATIALSNTPLAKGGAMAIFATAMFAYITNMNIPDPYATPLFILLFTPNLLAVGLSFLEMGKG
jgi:hypothetical protein